MIVYQASKSQFLQHALLEMAKVLQDQEIPPDAGVAIEYQRRRAPSASTS